MFQTASPRPSAIALVHVQIDDRNLEHAGVPPCPLSLHEARGDCGVVEHTKPATLVGIRVVGTAGNVGGDTLRQCRAARCDGRSDRAPGAICHGLAPGKADLTHCGRINLAIGDRLDIAWRMDQCQLTVGGRQRLHELNLPDLSCKAVPQQLVLGHRKPVPRRQMQNELCGVVNMHAPLSPVRVLGPGF